MNTESCGYCGDWNRQHPDQPPRTSCGPCDTCGEPGHVGAHPFLPISPCLCARHWQELAARPPGRADPSIIFGLLLLIPSLLLLLLLFL